MKKRYPFRLQKAITNFTTNPMRFGYAEPAVSPDVEMTEKVEMTE